MFHFAVSYKAVINGNRIETGTVGVISKANDYMANSVKTVVSDHYRQSDDSVNYVTVTITGHEKMEAYEYKAAKDSFIAFVGKQ